MLDILAMLCRQAVSYNNVRSAAGLMGDKLRDNHPGLRRTSGHTPRHLVAAGYLPGLARTPDAAFGTKLASLFQPWKLGAVVQLRQ